MEKVKLVVPCEIYSRVVGYFRPVNQWNPGKREEFIERRTLRPPRVQGHVETSGYASPLKEIHYLKENHPAGTKLNNSQLIS